MESIPSRDVLMTGSVIGNGLYWLVSVIRSVCVSNLQQIRYNWWAVASVPLIKFLHSQGLAKKPYLMKTLRLTVLLQQPTCT